MQQALASSALAARGPRGKKACSEGRKDRTYSQSYSRYIKACSCLPVEAQCVGAGLCLCAAPVRAANAHGGQPCEATVCMCPYVYGWLFSNTTAYFECLFLLPHDLKKNVVLKKGTLSGFHNSKRRWLSSSSLMVS